MKRAVSVYAVQSFSKERTDQKGISLKDEESVSTTLHPWGFSQGGIRDDIKSDITIRTPDSNAPDWGDLFFVTVERIEIPEGLDRDARIEFIREKAEELRRDPVKPILNGRKFR